MRRKELARILAVSVVAMVSLSGCSVWRSAVNYVRSDNEAVCPDVAILANTASLPVFDPTKGSDPSNVQYTVAMTDVTTRCDYSKRDNTADSNFHIQYTATRPPGGEAASYRVPYFLAITTNGQIIDKQIHWLEFEFPKAASSVSGEVAIDSYEFKMDAGKHAFEYHFVVGFQLTQAQIDYNKKMGQFAP